MGNYILHLFLIRGIKQEGEKNIVLKSKEQKISMNHEPRQLNERKRFERDPLTSFGPAVGMDSN